MASGLADFRPGLPGLNVGLLVFGWLICPVSDARAAQQVLQVPPVQQGQPPVDQTRENGARVFFELRLAEPAPVRGLTFEATVKNTAKKVYLHYTTIVTNGDVVNASAVEGNGRYQVALTLAPESVAKMVSETSRHAGRPLAIILDGEVVAVLTVSKNLGGGALTFGDFTGPDAMRIVSGLLRW